MHKQVRFEEVARGRLIDIAKQAPPGAPPQKLVRPSRKTRANHFFENKIALEPSDTLMPVRMRPRQKTLIDAIVGAFKKPQPKGHEAVQSRFVCATPDSLVEQRIVFPEPSRKPKGPPTVSFVWSETEGVWDKRRSSLGQVLDKVAQIKRNDTQAS